MAKIKLRRDLAATWTSTNPTLAAGEPGYETDTKKMSLNQTQEGLLSSELVQKKNESKKYQKSWK